MLTADQRFTLIISAIGLVFAVLCTLAGLLWRVAARTGQTLTEVKANTDDIKEIATALDRHIEWHIDRREPPPSAGRRRRPD